MTGQLCIAIRHQGPSSSRRVEGLQLTVTEGPEETIAMPAIVLVRMAMPVTGGSRFCGAPETHAETAHAGAPDRPMHTVTGDTKTHAVLAIHLTRR
jgi:hypothetical protein